MDGRKRCFALCELAAVQNACSLGFMASVIPPCTLYSSSETIGDMEEKERREPGMGGTILPAVIASKEEWQYLGPWVSGCLPWELWGFQASKSVNNFPGSWMAIEPPRGFPLRVKREEGENRLDMLSTQPSLWFLS